MPVWLIIVIVVVVIVGAGLLLNNYLNKQARRTLKSFDERLTHVLHSWELTDDKLVQWSRESLKELDQEAEEVIDDIESFKSDAMNKIKDLRSRIAKLGGNK